MDINFQIIDHAMSLGIKLTNAELGTEICQYWEDRVQCAAMEFERGDMEACQEMIDNANRYAI
jgi:hypothetical protein